MRSILYLILLLYTASFKAQQLTVALEQASFISIGNKYFVGGFQKNSFKLYALNKNLSLIDSVEYELKKMPPANELFLVSDTSHQQLNFFIEKKNSTKGIKLCFNQHLKLIIEITDADITSSDPLSEFNLQKIYREKYCYVVKTVSDTSGKMYYLSKYRLNDEVKNRQSYKFIWQFDFGKKDIASVHVFHADEEHIFAFVEIYKGERMGSWVLKINAQTGLLIRGRKVLSKANEQLKFGAYCIDTIGKELLIIGQVNTQCKPFNKIYIQRLDSLMEKIGYIEIPFNIIPANPKDKAVKPYLTRFSNAKVSKDGMLSLEVDFYIENNLSYTYRNTELFKVDLEGALTSKSIQIYEQFFISSLYPGTDLTDLNGKILKDTSACNYLLYTSPPSNPAKIAFKLNDENKPVWVLRKTDYKNSTCAYFYLAPGKKNYENKKLMDLKLSQSPGIFMEDLNNLLLYYYSSEKFFFIQKLKW